LTPAITQIVKALLGAAEPEDWGVQYPSLWQPSDAETAAARLQFAHADQVYLDAGVLNVDEVRLARFAGDTFGVSIHVDGGAPGAPVPGK
jgi:hypothetical protein